MDKTQELFKLLMELTNRQHKLIESLVPTMREMGELLIDGRQPTPEQRAEWLRLNSQVTQDVLGIAAAHKSILQFLLPQKLDS
jgi:hypothetical protein